MNKGLLLISHGSPCKEANEEFLSLVRTVQGKAPDYRVQAAFLDCASPDISDGLDSLIEGKSKEIIILPYFLGRGKHTTQDIPKIVHEKKEKHPDIIFDLKEPVGVLPEMINLVINTLTKKF